MIVVIHTANVVHVARDFLYIATAVAVINGFATILPRPWRKKD